MKEIVIQEVVRERVQVLRILIVVRKRIQGLRIPVAVRQVVVRAQTVAAGSGRNSNSGSSSSRGNVSGRSTERSSSSESSRSNSNRGSSSRSSERESRLKKIKPIPLLINYCSSAVGELDSGVSPTRLFRASPVTWISGRILSASISLINPFLARRPAIRHNSLPYSLLTVRFPQRNCGSV